MRHPSLTLRFSIPAANRCVRSEYERWRSRIATVRTPTVRTRRRRRGWRTRIPATSLHMRNAVCTGLRASSDPGKPKLAVVNAFDLAGKERFDSPRRGFSVLTHQYPCSWLLSCLSPTMKRGRSTILRSRCSRTSSWTALAHTSVSTPSTPRGLVTRDITVRTSSSCSFSVAQTRSLPRTSSKSTFVIASESLPCLPHNTSAHVPKRSVSLQAQPVGRSPSARAHAPRTARSARRARDPHGKAAAAGWCGIPISSFANEGTL